MSPAAGTSPSWMLTAPGKGTYGLDPDRHEYWRNGILLPGATRVLGAVGVSVDFEALCNSLPPSAADLIRRKREIGQAVHRATHYLDEGDLRPETVDDAVAGYVEAWRRCKADTGFVPVLLETPLVSWSYAAAGTPDRVGYFTKGKLGLNLPLETLLVGDLKTGDPEDAAAQFQTACYQHLIVENWKLEHVGGRLRACSGETLTPRRFNEAPRVSFELHDDGTYKIHVYEGGRDFRRFCCHLQTYWDQAERRKD